MEGGKAGRLTKKSRKSICLSRFRKEGGELRALRPLHYAGGLVLPQKEESRSGQAKDRRLPGGLLPEFRGGDKPVGVVEGDEAPNLWMGRVLPEGEGGLCDPNPEGVKATVGRVGL